MKPIFRTWTVAATLAALTFATTPARAQDAWPTQPIRFVVCCAGIIDALARVIGEQVAESAKQPVVIDTKPGVSGMLGAEYVAKAKPDGYTIFIGTNSTHAANQSLFKSVPYDFVRDFAPITGIGQGINILVVNPSTAARSVAELTALAKASPGKLTFGWGSSSVRAGAPLYKQMTGIDIVDVPFKTNPQATTALVGGQIDIMFADMATAVPLVKAGRLRALAITGTKRAAVVAEVPTMHEAGVANYDLPWWIAAWAPAGTPKEVVAKANTLIAQAIATKKVRDYFQTVALDAFPTSPEGLMKFQVAEYEKWKKIITTAGIEPQ